MYEVTVVYGAGKGEVMWPPLASAARCGPHPTHPPRYASVDEGCKGQLLQKGKLENLQKNSIQKKLIKVCTTQFMTLVYDDFLHFHFAHVLSAVFYARNR